MQQDIFWANVDTDPDISKTFHPFSYKNAFLQPRI